MSLRETDQQLASAIAELATRVQAIEGNDGKKAGAGGNNDRRAQERDERKLTKDLENFTKEMDGQMRSPKLINPKRREELQRHFQEGKPIEHQLVRKDPPPPPPASLAVVIVVNGEFKIAQFHYSGGLVDPPP